MFARKNGDNFELFNDDGSDLTMAPASWPMMWPIDSDGSIRCEHPNGIMLDAHDYATIAVLAPLED